MYFMAPCSAVPRLLFTLDSTWAVKDVVETVVTTVNTAAIATQAIAKRAARGMVQHIGWGLERGLGGETFCLAEWSRSTRATGPPPPPPLMVLTLEARRADETS